MIEIKTKDEFSELLVKNDTDVLLVKFGASWCGPCRVLQTTLSNMEGKLNNVTFAEVDVDEADEDFVNAFNVRGVPTLFFFKNGEEVGRKNGAIPETELIEFINSL